MTAFPFLLLELRPGQWSELCEVEIHFRELLFAKVGLVVASLGRGFGVTGFCRSKEENSGVW